MKVKNFTVRKKFKFKYHEYNKSQLFLITSPTVNV